ncbi:MAG: hypothetical protein ABH828_04210 [archaeon]
MNFHINGKNVKIIFNYNNYSKRKYRNDFKDFLDYHTKREEKDPEQVRQFDLKRIFYKEFQTIPYKGLAAYLSERYSYEFFMKTANYFFIKILEKVLNDYPKIITSEEFEIQVQVIRIVRREYYGAYDPEPSDKDHAYIEFNAVWVLNNIVMPWALYKKINYQLIYKFLVHELYHHVDNIAEAFIYEDKLEDKLKLKSKKISNYGVLFLFSVLFELRAEGFAEFASRNSNRFEINKNKILEFKKNLWILVTKRKKADAEYFFNKKLSTESYATYYSGNLMCFIIALFFCKNVTNQPKIIFDGKEFPIIDLNRLIDTKKTVSIMGMPREIYQKTLSYVNSIGPAEFLNMYNHACDHLEISYDNRVLWWKEFIKLKKKTTEIYEADRLKKVIKKGYTI